MRRGLSCALLAGSLVSLPAAAFPSVDGEIHAAVLQTDTSLCGLNCSDSQTSFSFGSISASGVAGVSASASLTGIPAMSVSAAGSHTSAGGAFANLTYSIEWVGPAGAAGSLPVDIWTALSSSISGDNASAGARFDITANVGDSGTFDVGVGCFTPISVGCTTPSFSGTLHEMLTPNFIYQITESVNAGAGYGAISDGAMASADPYVFLDPSYDNTAGYHLVISDGVGNTPPGVPPPPGTGVPEPASLLILAGGLFGLRLRRRLTRTR